MKERGERKWPIRGLWPRNGRHYPGEESKFTATFVKDQSHPGLWEIQ